MGRKAMLSALGIGLLGIAAASPSGLGLARAGAEGKSATLLGAADHPTQAGGAQRFFGSQGLQRDTAGTPCPTASTPSP